VNGKLDGRLGGCTFEEAYTSEKGYRLEEGCRLEELESHIVHSPPPPQRPQLQGRRLSSITRAPCRKVMGVPGQRWHAARNVASAT
jgi:hypothetical protein